MTTLHEAAQQALEALETVKHKIDNYQVNVCDDVDEAITALRERLAQPEQCQCPACKITPHASDCAVHNEPAYPKGACDCGAQPEQEPVAWMFQHEETGHTMCVDAQQVEWGFEKGNPRLKKISPLYTTPPQRKPLTDEEIAKIAEKYTEPLLFRVKDFARAIEATLKEKNT